MRRATCDVRGRTGGPRVWALCRCAAGGGGGLSMISTRTKERVRKSMQGAVESESEQGREKLMRMGKRSEARVGEPPGSGSVGRIWGASGTHL